MLRTSQLRARLSYANIIASLALFVALGGTATAALTLPRDSVGAVQIRAGAVRSAEIEANAVVSSDIRDESITVGDLTPGARSSLGLPRVRVATADGLRFPVCSLSLLDCTDLASIRVPAGRWLVQAKFSIGGFFGIADQCGLVRGDETVLDIGADLGHPVSTTNHASEYVALAAVMSTAPGTASTVVAMRCSRFEDDDLFVSHVVLTAIEVRGGTD